MEDRWIKSNILEHSPPRTSTSQGVPLLTE